MTYVMKRYMNTIFSLVILMINCAALCAAVVISGLKLLGFYPDTSWLSVGLFCLSCILYLIIGILIIKNAYTIVDGHKELKPNMLRLGKIFIVILLFIQFNFLSYMIHSRDLWGYYFYFVLVSTFFLDVKVTTIAGIEIYISLILCSIFRPEALLPVNDSIFVAEIVLRIVFISLGLFVLILIVYLLDHHLVNMKKNEIEANNERIENIICNAQSLSEKLLASGSELSQILDNESASAEELSATSEMLLTNSNELSQKSKKSLDNLSELKKWGNLVNENVENVKETSNKLLDKAESNEAILTDLQVVNQEAITSIDRTSSVVEKLTNAIKEIDMTFNIIDQISTSTNLLALNASIEAARAGEAGKGFSVVAHEVSNLAQGTKKSLDTVQKVIDKIRSNVNEMSHFASNNSQKLAQQDQYFSRMFESLKEMVCVIRASIKDIEEMNEAHRKQADVIKYTVTINEDIAKSIHEENKEFVNIASMVENNAQDIMHMSEEISKINKIVEQIDLLLNASGV